MKSRPLRNRRSTKVSFSTNNAYGGFFVVPYFLVRLLPFILADQLCCLSRASGLCSQRLPLTGSADFPSLFRVPAMQAPAFRRGQGCWGQRPQGLAFDFTSPAQCINNQKDLLPFLI